MEDVDSVVERFFDVEANEHVRRVLTTELSSRTTGSRYLTFNVFNVRLDFDVGVATFEDELDPATTKSLPLADLRRRLSP